MQTCSHLSLFKFDYSIIASILFENNNCFILLAVASVVSYPDLQHCNRFGYETKQSDRKYTLCCV